MSKAEGGRRKAEDVAANVASPLSAFRFRLSRGMTLVELLLVLAILVIIGSLVVPVFVGSFSSVRLRRAGDEVLARWAQARGRAIETGEIFQFRYASGTGTYQIEPWLPIAQDAAQGGAAATTAAASAAGSSEAGVATANNPSGVLNGGLPSEIVFQEGQIAAAAPNTTQQQSAPMESGGGLSTPILFFPDGTTSEASLVLMNDGQQYLRISLRALTGVGRATSVMTRDELQRSSGGR
jgi:prepilin-type N-terminal cleavage/methylation domain-containing protein